VQVFVQALNIIEVRVTLNQAWGKIFALRLENFGFGTDCMAEIGPHGTDSLPVNRHLPAFQQFPGIHIEKRATPDDQVRRVFWSYM
jgi:hypothetical protein